MNSPDLVTSWEQLAKALNVSARTLQRWRSRPDLVDKLPEPKDGNHSVASWKSAIAELGLGDAVEEMQARDGRGAVGSDEERQLRIEERRLRLERERFELEKAKERMLPVADYEAGLSATLGFFRATMLALPGRGAGRIVSRARVAVLALLKSVLTEKQYARIEPLIQTVPVDYADIEEILQEETDLVLRTLQPCDHLQPDPDTQ